MGRSAEQSRDTPTRTRMNPRPLWGKVHGRKQELLGKVSVSLSGAEHSHTPDTPPTSRGCRHWARMATCSLLRLVPPAWAWLSHWAAWSLTHGTATSALRPFIGTNSPECFFVFVCFFKKRTRSLSLSQGILKTPAKAITRS